MTYQPTEPSGQNDAWGSLNRYPDLGGCTGNGSVAGAAINGFDFWGQPRRILPTAVAATRVAINDLHGTGMEMRTTAVNGNLAGVFVGIPLTQWNAFPDVTFLLGRQPTVAARYFFALGTFTSLASGSGNAPAVANYVGLQFSAPRGDVNWQFIRRAAAGAQVVVNTGVPPATLAAASQRFRIRTSNAGAGVVQVELQLLDETGTVVASLGPTSVSCPQGAVLARPYWSIEKTAGAVAVGLQLYGMAMRSKGAVTGPP